MKTRIVVLLLFTLAALDVVLSQDDDAAAAAAADAGGDAGGDASGEEGSDGGGDECEESWEYIEFLRSISESLEETFGDIRDVQNKIGPDAITQAVSQTLTQVLKIRESVLDR